MINIGSGPRTMDKRNEVLTELLLLVATLPYLEYPEWLLVFAMHIGCLRIWIDGLACECDPDKMHDRLISQVHVVKITWFLIHLQEESHPLTPLSS